MPVSDDLFARSIIMPVPPAMSSGDIEDVVRGFKKVAETVLG